ncbi:MAG: hypothetical protein Q9191_004001 [Dirinaria sp. TL-2023a]
MNASVPIEASGIIPVDQSDVAGIPPLALQIPDFEGQAILRIFSNSTESEIGCYSAVITNGATFSHPNAVGTVLGLFTLVAVGSSFATSMYGNDILITRTHYAHSLSVFVIFAVFHHIFYTGALSLNWPSVLAAFWSNFAWTGGMIYSQSMQNSINQLIGSNKGNTSMVGAAASGKAADNIGGGYQISQIYKRSSFNLLSRDIGSVLDKSSLLKSRALETALSRRDGPVRDASDGYSYYGHPVKPGLPLPGNYSGFAGTLSQEDIPASNAFMTGFLWWLIFTTIVATSLIAFKWLLEGLTRAKVLKKDKLTYFRAHWIGYTILAVLRTCFVAFFMMMFLTLFQFAFTRTGGGTAVAAIIFLIFFVGMMGLGGYALFYRLRYGHYEARPDRLHLEKTKRVGRIPVFGLGSDSKRSEENEQRASAASVPFMRVSYINEDTQQLEVHQDEEYIKRFGWLASRFRRTRWWFFAVWLVYEFIRACFYAGAAGQAATQVFGLLIIEFVALVAFCILRPFEGARLNVIMVYCLGFSKVTTLALSAAFDTRFNLQRITTTVIGIVIIVIQGILTIVLMIAIAVGAISSYMSVMRNHEDFRPRSWAQYRQRYFEHLEKAVPDVPPPPAPAPVPEEPKEPYFSVNSIRRVAKIEDEDNDDYDPKLEVYGSRTSVVAGPSGRKSRAASLNSQRSHSNLPFGARPHRQSWSSRDFSSQSFHVASQRNSMLMSRTTLSGHKTSSGSLRDEVQSQRFGSPFRPETPQRGFSSPQRIRTPEALPLNEEISDITSSRPGTVSPAPTDAATGAGLEVKRIRNGKERAVDFALLPELSLGNDSPSNKPSGLENQRTVIPPTQEE